MMLSYRSTASALAISLATALFAVAPTVYAQYNTTSSQRTNAVRADFVQALPNIPQPCTLMFHASPAFDEPRSGTHKLKFKIYNAGGALLSEQSATVQFSTQGGYDVTLTNVPPALRVRTEQFTIGVSMDQNSETRWPVSIRKATEFQSDVYIAIVDKGRLEQAAEELAERSDRDSEAAHANDLATRNPNQARTIDPMSGNVQVKSLAEYAGEGYHSTPSIRAEYAVAGPSNTAFDPQHMTAYGRASLEVRNLVTLFGGKLGLAGRVMQSGDDFHYSAAGIVADVNNDGSVIATIGVSQYRAGTNVTEQAIVAPFTRLQYFSSQSGLFLYSEVEATVHLHSYLSGTAGLGVSFLGAQIVAGYHYSMYSVPNDISMKTISGFSSMVSFAF